MGRNENSRVHVDKEGRLVIEPGFTSWFGIEAGDRIHASMDGNSLRLHRPPRQLVKLYIEPTSQCNLDCITCMHNDWNEPSGRMTDEVFASVIKGIREFAPLPDVFFGGFGEPLSHPAIVDMIAETKALGGKVELITNATLLTAEMSASLIEAGLDMLWVSLDGATPQSFNDIRLGALLPRVLENMHAFRQAVITSGEFEFFGGIIPKTRLGISFVAMKRNIADLPAVIKIGQQFGAEKFMVTNVLPYTKDMVDQTLYQQGFSGDGVRPLIIPEIHAAEAECAPVYGAIRQVYGSRMLHHSEPTHNRCPFIENGAGAISWDGNLSPCLPLLHDHTSYPGHGQNEKRVSRRWHIGNVVQKPLKELWNTNEHIRFRERVQAFDFPPCSGCGGCELSIDNEADCFGNEFPTCGGCPWAQGVIQCP